MSPSPLPDTSLRSRSRRSSQTPALVRSTRLPQQTFPKPMHAVRIVNHPHHATTPPARPRWNVTTITDADRSLPLPMLPSARLLEMSRCDTSNADAPSRWPRCRHDDARDEPRVGVTHVRCTERSSRIPQVRFYCPIDAAKMKSALRSTKRRSLKLHPKLSARCFHQTDALIG
jgi:hypothetical protein